MRAKLLMAGAAALLLSAVGPMAIAQTAGDAKIAKSEANVAKTADGVAKADAKIAERIANKAERTTATAGGTLGRATGLRTVWTATMTKPSEAANHYWSTRKDDIMAFVQSLADEDVRRGIRTIPGFEITSDKKAV